MLSVKDNKSRLDPKVLPITHNSDMNCTFEGPLCINLPTLPK